MDSVYHKVLLYRSSDHTIFVELGGGVDDVQVWCRDGAFVEFVFR